MLVWAVKRPQRGLGGTKTLLGTPIALPSCFCLQFMTMMLALWDWPWRVAWKEDRPDLDLADLQLPSLQEQVKQIVELKLRQQKSQGNEAGLAPLSKTTDSLLEHILYISTSFLKPSLISPNAQSFLSPQSIQSAFLLLYAVQYDCNLWIVLRGHYCTCWTWPIPD